MAPPNAPNLALVGRLLVASSIVVFAVAVAVWNGLVPVDDSARPLVTGALCIAGLLDLGLGIVMFRKGTSS